VSKECISTVSDVQGGKLGGHHRVDAIRRIAVTATAWAVVVMSALVALVVGPSASSAIVAENTVADIRVQGSVENAAPGGGIDTQDEIRYRITIENRGPDDIPAGSLLVVASVATAEGGVATIEVSRFNGPLGRAGNGSCGVGRQETLTCTNRQDINSGRDISLVFANRHPTAVAGPLSFSISVNPAGDAYVDGNAGNNSFGGPSYAFAEQPVTTTTTTLATTTSIMEDTTTTVDPDAPTTTVDPNATTTTMPESTTTLESTTTTVATTTTLAPATTLPATTATTVAPPTTVEVTTSVAAMADDDASLPGQESSSSVLGATGETEDPTVGGQAALGPTTQNDGGTPWLLLAGIFAVLLLIGGVGLGLYAHYNRPPPLVDIRQYR
jgi:hypothetical protein